MPELLFQYEYLTKSGEKKSFRIMSGSITELEGDFDVVVCSAFHGNYYPLRHTLIGSLYRDCYVSVDHLAENPAIRLPKNGCWLSEKTESQFHRVACVEITALGEEWSDRVISDSLLKKSFSSLRMLLEQAELFDIPISRVVLPILGAGAQMLSVDEVAGPLVKQLFCALETVDTLREVTVCEYSRDKALLLTELVKKIIEGEKKTSPDVFISYSSKQFEEALTIRNALSDVGVSCWMAPDSIPGGSQYWQEIPIALANTKTLVLLLTPDAESSKWVPKEVNTAIENRSVIIPFQPFEYINGAAFRFILSDIQIIRAWNYPEEARLDRLVTEVLKSLVGNGSGT